MEQVTLGSEKLSIGFIADILYLKGVICLEELEAILDIKHPSDLQVITDKMIGGEYNIYKRGELRSAWEGKKQ